MGRLDGPQERLQTAHRSLETAWAAASACWRDANHEEMEAMHITPFEREATATAAALGHLNEVLSKALATLRSLE